MGAIFQWEKGIFDPRDEKKGVLVALRKLGRREVAKILEEKNREAAAKKAATPKKRKNTGKKKAARRKARK